MTPQRTTAAAPTSSPAPTALPSPERLRQLLHRLTQGLLERDTAVHLALLTALAGEHLLLIGPPGTAKSALARRLQGAFAGARWFERLLTRFSTPEELFGPLSLKALEHDRYERLVDGYLPTAGIAFLDEVFKANSAILNALLTLLNERQFDNGTERQPTPLVAVIGASNEVPSDDNLQAFYDRFLVRVPVAPVSDKAFEHLLRLQPDTTRPPVQALSERDRLTISVAAARCPLSPAFTQACAELRAWLANKHRVLSDRRWRQFVGLACTAAASEGRALVDELDLWLAPFVANAQPEDTAELQAWFITQVAHAQPEAAPWLARAVQAFEQQLSIEQQLRDDEGSLDHSAGKLALARAIGMTEDSTAFDSGANDGPGMVRLTSERLQVQLRHRWSSVHIEARVAQVQQVADQVAAARQAVQALLHALQARLAPRLWMPAALQAQLLAGPQQTLQVLQDFAQRLAAASAGFAALPRDSAQQAVTAPAPVAWAAA